MFETPRMYNKLLTENIEKYDIKLERVECNKKMECD